MKIALAQMSMVENQSENITKTFQFTDQAVQANVDLLFFPELQFSPFFPQYRKHNIEPYVLSTDDLLFKKISNISLNNDMIISPNTVITENQHVYDASLFYNGALGLQGVSKMVHIMQSPNFYEQDYYTPSDGGFNVFNTKFGKVGIVICFDRHFPESIRSCALKGANLILIPTANIDGEDQRYFEWELRVQARQNSVYIALCNRVGHEGKVLFIGKSMIIDPTGQIITSADDQEKLLIHSIDLSISKNYQLQNQYLNLLRPEKYEYNNYI